MRVRIFLVLLLATACAHAPAPQPLPTLAAGIQVIDAAPEKGFNFPYLLRLPAHRPAGTSYLLVEPNNTGKVSDDLAVHLAAAKDLAEKAIGGYVATKLDLPLLVPVFPRPETDWQLYTHMLDRDTMLIERGPLRRVDLQLLAMIDDARARLSASGFPVEEKVLLTGFSASGTFSNRFTLLHPERVRAVATGGLNGLLMIPARTLDSVALPFPLGLADLEKVAGSRFDEAAWRRVPQFIYMGALDDNDALRFDDGYTDPERAIVFHVIGDKMQPDRWQRVQTLYREAGANATFHTYEGVGHWTDGKINDELTEFFRGFIAGTK
ncbi:MAG: hypothetical protein QOH21_3282 [Acidobacteriota bacterium]|jgi:predicted esterase|nr:hypothetical protein [Acidobacteriota bacterium]